jgi:hypothetical protein
MPVKPQHLIQRYLPSYDSDWTRQMLLVDYPFSSRTELELRRCLWAWILVGRFVFAGKLLAWLRRLPKPVYLRPV